MIIPSPDRGRHRGPRAGDDRPRPVRCRGEAPEQPPWTEPDAAHSRGTYLGAGFWRLLAVYLPHLRRIDSVLPPEVALAVNSVPAADVRADITNWEPLQRTIVESIVTLEEMRLTLDQKQRALGPRAEGPEVTSTGFDGVWGSTYGSELILERSGNRVTGTYDSHNGRVEFDITGERTLDGYWIEDGSACPWPCESPH